MLHYNIIPICNTFMLHNNIIFQESVLDPKILTDFDKCKLTKCPSHSEIYKVRSYSPLPSIYFIQIIPITDFLLNAEIKSNYNIKKLRFV